MTAQPTDEPRREQRLDARVSAADKQLVERAAALSGHSTTGFIVASLREKARQVIREHETVDLTARASEQIVAALQQPPEPSEALQRAVRDYEDNVERHD